MDRALDLYRDAFERRRVTFLHIHCHPQAEELRELPKIRRMMEEVFPG